MQLPVSIILGAAFPVFLLLGLGVVLRRTGVLTQQADQSLMQVVVRVFYPCLFLDYIIGNDSLMQASNLVAAPLVGFFSITLGFVVAHKVARWIGLERGKGLRSFAFCNGIYNYGYIPIPLVLVIFPGRETMGVLLVHNLGVEIAMWTTGIILLSGRIEKGMLLRIFNPPIIALVAALLINTAGLDSHVPEWLSRFISMLGACTIPIGILLAGASMADLLSRQMLTEQIKVPLASVAVRLGLLPAVFVAVAAFMPGLSTELRQVMLVQAAMPAGIFPIVLARHYGGDASVAIKVVLATTLFSVVTMPLWIIFGYALVF